MKDYTTPADVNSPLVNYALKGLERCWLADLGCWSHIYHLDGRDRPNESVPASDVFYTLNVLLGFSRVNQIPHGIDLPATFQRNAARLLDLPVPTYAFGMALWAAAELDLRLPGDLLSYIESLLSEKSNWLRFRAQDLGMLLIGVIGQAKRDPQPWSRIADELFAFLVERFYCSVQPVF